MRRYDGEERALKVREINGFSDFCAALKECGFSMGGGNAKGVFALIPFDWREEPPGCPVRWHTGDADTDPWEWRMRVLEERDDVAYAKVFFRLSGYITREWYPLFLAVRRRGKNFEEMLRDGEVGRPARRIYEALSRLGAASVPELKREAGFSREEKAAFERGLTELQMKLLVTMCGRGRKVNRFGEEYGWENTLFCTPESFWGEGPIREAEELSPAEAEEAVLRRVFELNPAAEERTARRFVRGG